MKKRWLEANFKIAAFLITFETNKNYSVSIKRVGLTTNNLTNWWVNNWFKIPKNEIYKWQDIITAK